MHVQIHHNTKDINPFLISAALISSPVVSYNRNFIRMQLVLISVIYKVQTIRNQNPYSRPSTCVPKYPKSNPKYKSKIQQQPYSISPSWGEQINIKPLESNAKARNHTCRKRDFESCIEKPNTQSPSSYGETSCLLYRILLLIANDCREEQNLCKVVKMSDRS